MSQHNSNNNNNNNESNWSNETYRPDYTELSNYNSKEEFADLVLIWILSVVEVPIMLLTLFALCFLIKSHRAASVFVIHLILSDVMQIICKIIYSSTSAWVCDSAYMYSLIVGVFFMACIAFERYLLVSHPIWHRTHQSLKSTCYVISVIIWFVPLIFAEIDPPCLRFNETSLTIAFLIPYPIIILCFAGTWRGLSHSISLTPLKRKMILGTLFLVVLSYTFLILPRTIVNLIHYFTGYDILQIMLYRIIYNFAMSLVYLNPLADCLLYLFMRSDAADIMPSIHCCCTSDTLQISHTSTQPVTLIMHHQLAAV